MNQSKAKSLSYYKDIGFKCGIEIHQQLDGKKLFCSCPATNSKEKPDISIKRILRSVVGETGIVDNAAKYESKKGKYFEYYANSSDCCLVELDCEPPHELNRDALNTALEVSQMLNMKIVDYIQFMRKTVIDGSNTSGFQRTALIATDGYIDTSLGKVRIDTLCLEEEAAQKLEDKADYTSYRLDRLGIALIEIATSPDIKTPEHAKEVAEKIGLILRSTAKVKRGIGTIRQDVNISIKNSKRTEIKGFQDLKSIPKVIDNEIKRHQELIKKNVKIKDEVRKANPDFTTSFLRPMPGSARMYPETDIPVIKPDLTGISTIKPISQVIDELKSKFGLNEDTAKAIAKKNNAQFFELLCTKYNNLKPSFIAETIISVPKELRRKHGIDIQHDDDFLDRLFAYLNDGKIAKDSIINIFIDYANNSLNFEKYKLISADELEKAVKEIVYNNKGATQGALMGEIMKKFRGKVDGKKANELIKKYINW